MAQAYREHPRPGKATGLLALVVALLAGTATAGSFPGVSGQVPTEDRAALEAVTEEPSLFTRTAGEPFLGRREVFEYLLDHPEFATHVTRALRAARYRIWSTPDGLALDDGWGVTGHFRLVHAMAGRRVMYARGQYRQRFLPDITGRAVVVLEYAFEPAAGGRTMVNAVVTGYVKLDSTILGFATRLAGPVAERKAALEARRLVKVFARVSRAIEDDPAAVWDKVRQQSDAPARDLEEFGRLLRPR